jgi:hypothetical protein
MEHLNSILAQQKKDRQLLEQMGRILKLLTQLDETLSALSARLDKLELIGKKKE